MAALRPAWIDESALSPQEHEAWHDWYEALQPTVANLSQSDALDSCWEGLQAEEAEAATSRASRNARLDREVLGFLKAEGQDAMKGGQLLAMLRLIQHAQSGGLLCRDHMFLQVPEPTRMTVKRSNPFRSTHLSRSQSCSHGKPAISTSLQPPSHPAASSNPRSTSNPNPAPQPNAGLGVPPNPFRHRQVSAPSDSGASSTTGPTSPDATTVSSAPPLPPRQKPAPPPPPPQRISSAYTPSGLGRSHSLSIISSSSLTDRPPRGPSVLAVQSMSGAPDPSSSSERKKRPPPAAPKPKLLGSTHIGPSTNMRPSTSTSTIASKSSSGSEDGLLLGQSGGAAPKSRSRASDSSASINQVTTPIAEQPVTAQESAHARLGTGVLPPPPPKRRPSLGVRASTESTPSISAAAAAQAPSVDFRKQLRPASHSRSQSASHASRPTYVITPSGYNPVTATASEFGNRLSRAFINSKDYERTAEWVQQARGSITARAGSSAEREALVDDSDESANPQHAELSTDTISSSSSSVVSEAHDPARYGQSRSQQLQSTGPHEQQGYRQLH